MTYPVLLCVPSSVPCLILLCVPSSSAFLNPPVHPFLYTIFCYSLGVPHLSCLHYRSRSVYMYKHKHACTGADVFRFSGEYMYMYQACRVVRYGTITVCTVRTVHVKLRRTTVIFTPYFTVIKVNYGTVYGTVPSWHCQCKNCLRKGSQPQHLPFPPPACSSYVLTPQKCYPEAGLGLHQLGGRAQQWLAWKLKVRRST